MKEQKRKYDRPLMERVLVELEDGFCAGSANVQNPNTDNGRINAHDVNMDFGKADGISGGIADFSSDRSWEQIQ